MAGEGLVGVRVKWDTGAVGPRGLRGPWQPAWLTRGNHSLCYMLLTFLFPALEHCFHEIQKPRNVSQVPRSTEGMDLLGHLSHFLVRADSASTKQLFGFSSLSLYKLNSHVFQVKIINTLRSWRLGLNKENTHFSYIKYPKHSASCSGWLLFDLANAPLHSTS